MLKELGFSKSLIIFGIASIVLIIETQFIIPYLSRVTGLEVVIFWFAVSGLGLFLPMFFVAIYILKREGHQLTSAVWKERLRFKTLNVKDVLWSVGAIIVIGVISALIIKVLGVFVNNVNLHPSWMYFEPLSDGRYYILLIWFPFWILNIMGEEVLWRGVILPRQEIVFGKQTWFYHGLFWSIFHIAFGWQLLLTLIPILFIQSYVVQRRKNSWTGVIIHAGINGPGFVAVSLGLV